MGIEIESGLNLRFYVLMSVGSFFFFYCDNKKEIVQQTEVFHIEDGDTISYVFIPNSFSPDGDVINDCFKPICSGFGMKAPTLLIYYPSGSLLFESRIINTICTWDGMDRGLMVTNGNYIWRLIGTDTSGYAYDLSGTVQVLK